MTLARNILARRVYPLNAVFDGLRDKRQNGQRLPHTHIIRENASTSLWALNTRPGLCYRMAIPLVDQKLYANAKDKYIPTLIIANHWFP
jgi:hypothetical protein